MAQFGGQKNPPWATQFAATAVSQPGHSGQSIDLNSLHCKCSKSGALTCFIHYANLMLCSFYMDFILLTIFPRYLIMISYATSTFSIECCFFSPHTSLKLVLHIPSPQHLVCSSRLFWELLLLFTLSSQPWLQSLSATSLLQTISCLSKLLRCSSKQQQLPLQHYSRSVTAR